MSPTIINEDWFRLYFYSNEHIPMHVHVEKWDQWLKYDLEKCIIIKNYWMKASELRKVLSIIEDNKEFIIDEWKKYFNS